MSKIDQEVVRGKEIWESNNCMGCHTILGEGAYYAPELTKVMTEEVKAYVKAVLMSPRSLGTKRTKNGSLRNE